MRTSVAELTSWITHLDGLGIGHSPIIKASSGYGPGFLTPDGMQIRLYAEDDAVRAENVDSDGTVHLSRMTLDEVRPGES